MTADTSIKHFEKQGIGTMYERVLQQTAMIFSPLGGEGGLFVFIGRKK